jgi:hypothetical protein
VNWPSLINFGDRMMICDYDCQSITCLDQTIVLDVQAVVTKNMLNEDILFFLNTATSSGP